MSCCPVGRSSTRRVPSGWRGWTWSRGTGVVWTGRSVNIARARAECRDRRLDFGRTEVRFAAEDPEAERVLAADSPVAAGVRWEVGFGTGIAVISGPVGKDDNRLSVPQTAPLVWFAFAGVPSPPSPAHLENEPAIRIERRFEDRPCWSRSAQRDPFPQPSEAG
jgi:hypothetical protein